MLIIDTGTFREHKQPLAWVIRMHTIETNGTVYYRFSLLDTTRYTLEINGSQYDQYAHFDLNEVIGYAHVMKLKGVRGVV